VKTNRSIMPSRLCNRESGVTLIEILIGMAIFAMIALAVGSSLFQNFKGMRIIKDKAFAAEKAIQMMEELRSIIADTSAKNVGVLDNYDDGTAPNYVLTTHTDVTSAGNVGDPLSGNASRRYYRIVNVTQMANEPLARRVQIRVYLAATATPLAETYSVLYTIQNQYVPTQVYDTYILALENVPGWWASLSTMKSSLDNIIQDLHTRNPGLEFRTHWISQLSYGRDPYYSPYVNSTTYSDVTAPTGIYFYPSLMHAGGSDFYYYVPTSFNGRINLDGTLTNWTTASPTANQYSLADQFNHAERYPDELSLYNSAVAYASANNLTTPEITWRLLLEQMNSQPWLYKNILLMNLHGELLPMPPIRNYSDPAKSPGTNANVRAVAHPQQLSYNAGAAVSLRVYAYVTNPTSGVWTSTSTISTMTIVLPNISLTSGNLASVRIASGTAAASYSWQNAPNVLTKTMWYTIAGDQPSVGQTLITLYNTPVLQGLAAGNTGLPSSARLYGLDYIPCQVSAVANFTEGKGDLTVVNSTAPKNTARWVINFNAGAFPTSQTPYEFDLRIGTHTVTPSGNLSDMSDTFVWVGSSAPITEQYQFMGDPRHMPYTDVKTYHGYNWWFKNISALGYDGFTKAVNDGWTSNSNTAGMGVIYSDFPRFMQILRAGLLNSGAIWTTMSGWSMFYMGMGGEMGDDGHVNSNYTNGLPIIATPWSPASSSLINVNEMITDTWAGTANQVNMRLVAKQGGSWTSFPWLGELYPDSDYATWSCAACATPGNLPTGSGSNYYRSQYFDSTYKLFPSSSVVRAAQMVAPSFVNGNPAADSTHALNHNSADSGVITTTGTTVSTVFNFPLITNISNTGQERPFTLTGATLSPEWADSIYSSQRTTTGLLETYFDSVSGAAWNSSALISITSGTNSTHLVVNGVASQSNFGTPEIGKLIMISMIRGYQQSGNPNLVSTGRVTQVPLITISSPTIGQQFLNPTNISIQWSSAWTRWDGQLYTDTYSAGFSEAVTTTYNIKYSTNTGKSWVFADDNSAASAGVLNSAHSFSSPYTWNTPASTFHEGDYLIRVEQYRQNYPLHYTYHEREVYLQR